MKLVDNRLAFLVSVLKAREARAATPEMLEEILLRAASVADAADFTRGTDLGDFLAGHGAARFEQLDALLWRYLHEYFERIRALRPYPESARLIERYLQKYDVANTVSALRALSTQSRPYLVPVGTLRDRGLLDAFSNAQTPGEIAALLVTGGMADYAGPIREVAEMDGRTLALVERRLEGLYLIRLRQTLQGMDDSGVLLAAYGAMVDHLVLGRVLRRTDAGHQAEMEGGDSWPGGGLLSPAVYRELPGLSIAEIAARLQESPYRDMARDVARQVEQQGRQIIDRVLDLHLYRRMRELLSPRSLSPCAVLWHLFFKESELRGVRLAFKAALDRLPPAEAREYLLEAS